MEAAGLLFTPSVSPGRRSPWREPRIRWGYMRDCTRLSLLTLPTWRGLEGVGSGEERREMDAGEGGEAGVDDEK